MVGSNIRPFGARKGSVQLPVSVRPAGESLGNLQFPRSGFQSRQDPGHGTLNTGSMSRGQALRTMGLGAGAVAAAGLGISSIASSAKTVTCPGYMDQYGYFVVKGTGTSSDAGNVQCAVNSYPKVKLSGAFSFGTKGSVSITRDVEIVGDGSAVINGGYYVFLCEGPYKFVVRNIKSAGATDGFIRVYKTRGFEATGNTITNLYESGKDPTYLAIAIGATTELAPNPSDISGNILISGNYIDIGNVAMLSSGIYVLIFEANVNITRNDVRNVNYIPLWVGYNYGSVNIVENNVMPGPGIPDADYTMGNGITCWYGAFNVYRNNIFCENPGADGISMTSANNSVINGNNIVMRNSQFGGITLYTYEDMFGLALPDSRNNVVTNNKVTGDMVWALGIITMAENAVAEQNVFKSNNVSDVQLIPVANQPYGVEGAGHVLFMEGANYNTVAGFSGTVIDDGIGNNITGYSKIGNIDPVLGQIIKDAVARKNAALQLLKKNR